jgi:hypothetical protein
MGGFNVLRELQLLRLISRKNEANSGESWYIMTLAIRMAQTRIVP